MTADSILEWAKIIIPSIAASIAALAAVVSAFIGMHNASKIQEVHLSVNGRLGQMKAAWIAAAKALGFSHGIKTERAKRTLLDRKSARLRKK